MEEAVVCFLNSLSACHDALSASRFHVTRPKQDERKVGCRRLSDAILAASLSFHLSSPGLLKWERKNRIPQSWD